MGRSKEDLKGEQTGDVEGKAINEEGSSGVERDQKAEQRRECGILPLDLLVGVFRRPSQQNR